MLVPDRLMTNDSNLSSNAKTDVERGRGRGAGGCGVCFYAYFSMDDGAAECLVFGHRSAKVTAIAMKNTDADHKPGLCSSASAMTFDNGARCEIKS
jgi:hypothetical protein